LLRRPGADVWAALAIATLGGMTSYLVGRLIPQHKPLTGIAALRRHGAPALLSWVPIIGERPVRRLGLDAQ
jgi:membrane protein YqaA with SNARE-associated domain